MLHKQLKGMKHIKNILENMLPLHTPYPLRWGQKVFFFIESSHVAYQINRNKE